MSRIDALRNDLPAITETQIHLNVVRGSVEKFCHMCSTLSIDMRACCILDID